MGLFMGISELLVLWIGARDVIAGRMTVGELVAFNGYLVMLSWPMIAFGWVTNLLQRGRASWGRMLEVMDTPPAIDDADEAPNPVAIANMRGAIELRNLSFAYGDVQVLADIIARDRSRPDRGDRRPHGLGQVHAAVAPRAAARSAAGDGVRRRPSTCASCRWRRCAARSASSRRSRSCSPTRIAENMAFGAGLPGRRHD